MAIRKHDTILPISPFVDRKAYEYTCRLIQSPSLPRRIRQTIDFLSELGISTVQLLEPCENAEEDSDPCDYERLVKKLGRAQLIARIRDNVLPLLLKEWARIPKLTPIDRRMNDVKRVFRLSKVETDVIAFYFVLSALERTSSFAGMIDQQSITSPAVLMNRVPQLLGYRPEDVQRHIKDSKILECQLLDSSPYLSIADWLNEYLWGTSRGTLTSRFFMKYSDSVLALEDHLIPPEEIRMLRLMLGRMSGPGTSVLLYGEPGTGKTELGRSIARAVGKDLYVINHKENDSIPKLKAAMIAASNIVNPRSSIILVDEADVLLNTHRGYFNHESSNSKSWINTFLDECRHRMIWITNDSSNIEKSTMRRFAFSLKFKSLNTLKKIKIFNHALLEKKLQKFFSESDIRRICQLYAIDAGAITSAIKNLDIRKTSSRPEALKKIHLLLKHHQIATTGRQLSNMDNFVSNEYSLVALNTSEKVSTIKEALMSFDAQSYKTRGLNLLFYGRPGTGKTQFAKYLANTVGKEIEIRRASDLISCWVGETEKLIAGAFEKANQDNAILLIDEADSFFYPRSDAIRSWERTQTNEMLTQMEAFAGILICTTNFIEGLDEAALRRFQFKVEFRSLTPQGITEMYKATLSPLVNKPLEAQQERSVQSMIGLTPGDFYVVKEMFAFRSPLATHQALLHALEQELKLKSRRNSHIGF